MYFKMDDVRGMMADVLVTLEDVTSVNLVLHIIQHCVIAVGYDGINAVTCLCCASNVAILKPTYPVPATAMFLFMYRVFVFFSKVEQVCQLLNR